MSEGYDPAIFDVFAEIEGRSFWYCERNRLIVQLVQREFPRACDVLEVGCGDGFALSALRTALPAARLVGLEPFSEGIAIAQRRVPSAEIIQGTVEGLEAVGSFDLVCAFDVLEHLEDDHAALGQIRRALTPGGGLLLFVPQHPRLWSGADEFAHHRRRYTRTALREVLATTGFEPVMTTSFVSLLLPALVAARAFQQVRQRPYDPAAELVPSLGLNSLFARVLRAERWMIRRGVRFPAGGTLIVVARTRPG